MGQGIVLLVMIALIITYVVTRTRRRMGMLVTGKTWLVVMAVVDHRRAGVVGQPDPLTAAG